MCLRICLLIITTVVCVSSNPVPNVKPSLTILQMMSNDANVCNFPPPEVLSNPTSAPFIIPCNKQLPPEESLGHGIDGLRNYLDNIGDNFAFLCMGFYDLSTQICHSKIPPAGLFHNVSQFVNTFGHAVSDPKFCTDIEPLIKQTNVKHSDVTSDWVAVLEEVLSSHKSCESMCVHNDKVIPLCNVLFWGLGMIQQQQQPKVAPKPTSAIPVDSQMDGEDFPQDQREEQGVDETDPSKSLEAPDLTEPLPDAGKTQEHSEPVLKNNDPSVAIAVPVPQEKKNENVLPNNNINPPDVKQPQQVVEIPKSNSKSTEVKSPVPENKPTPEMKPVESKPVETKPVEPVPVKPKTSSSSTQVSSSLANKVTESSLPAQLDIDNPPLKGESNEDYADGNSPDGMDQERDDEDYENNRKTGDAMDTHKEPSDFGLNNSESEFVSHNNFTDAEDSHFFAYFLTVCVICIVGYLVFHNKHKILALVLEGRKGGARGRSRRPSTSSYRKLDSTLEEAISSSAPRTNPHVIY